jgi:hypothetical protein
MSNIQRVIMAVYFPLTIFFVVADNLYPADNLVRLIKFMTILTIFIAAFSIRKKFSEQKLMTIAVLFAVLGDFFLGFGERIPGIKSLDAPLGMLGFMISYIFLIIALHKNFSISRKNLLAVVPIALVYIPVFLNLARFITGPMFVAASIFGLVLCYMCWTALCCLLRGYFTRKTAWLLSLSGCLIFISDIVVANALFNPLFKGHFVPLLQNIIWITFVPAWALILATVAEENLKVQSSTLYR